MKLKPAEIRARLNSTYWFVPVLMTFAAVAAVFAAVLLDRRLVLEDGWLRFLYPSSLEGARALLSSATGSMITVVSVTFSVTVVALTVASQHFGPRLLDNFMRETGSKIVLGILIGTFVYCAALLSAIGETSAAPFVPGVALVGAVALLAISVGALIYFVHHVAHSIQLPHIVDRIGGELEASILRAFATNPGRDQGPTAAEPDDVALVASTGNGYIQRIDERRLARIAERADARVWIRRCPGDFVIPGAALAAVAPARAMDSRFRKAATDAYILGPNRTTWQDPAFSVDKLVEVALRALSPAINEPFTAIACIDQLGRGLSRAATCAPRSPVHCDAAGRPRVYVPRHTFPTLLDAAFDPIRIFAGSNPAIYDRLLATIRMLAPCTESPEQLDALRQHARRCHDAALEGLTSRDDRARVGVALRAATDACDTVRTPQV